MAALVHSCFGSSSAVGVHRKRRRIALCASMNGATKDYASAEQAAGDLWDWIHEVSKGKLVSRDAAAVQVKEGPLGLGLFAKKKLSRGQEVLAVPKSVWIDTNVVRESEIGKYCEDYKPWIQIALFLLHEKAKRLSSRWRPYIRVLPKSSDSPLFWSDEELTELKGTQLLNSVTDFKNSIQREYEKVLEEVVKPRPDVFDSSLFTLEAFTWAFNILRSRTFPPLVGRELALVPLADLVNHGFGLPQQDPGWSVRAAGLFSRDELLSVQCAADCLENEEILVEYGKNKSNSQLALDYGFVEYDGKNDRDRFTLALELPESTEFFDDKLDILESNGWKTTEQYIIRRGEEPSINMLAFLRLLMLGGTDAFLLEALFRRDVFGFMALPVSPENERDICQAMISGCQNSLGGYSTTIEEDEELLRSGDLTVRKKIAVVIRLGEKQILQDQLSWFENHKKNLRTLEYYQERRLKSLGLVDEKGNMTPWEEVEK